LKKASIGATERKREHAQAGYQGKDRSLLVSENKSTIIKVQKNLQLQGRREKGGETKRKGGGNWGTRRDKGDKRATERLPSYHSSLRLQNGNENFFPLFEGGQGKEKRN